MQPLADLSDLWPASAVYVVCDKSPRFSAGVCALWPAYVCSFLAMLSAVRPRPGGRFHRQCGHGRRPARPVADPRLPAARTAPGFHILPSRPVCPTGVVREVRRIGRKAAPHRRLAATS